MAFQLSGKLRQSIASYIEKNYVDISKLAVYGAAEERQCRARIRRNVDAHESRTLQEEMLPCTPMAAPKAASLEDMLK